jgi:hypothetical protein
MVRSAREFQSSNNFVRIKSQFSHHFHSFSISDLSEGGKKEQETKCKNPTNLLLEKDEFKAKARPWRHYQLPVLATRF